MRTPSSEKHQAIIDAAITEFLRRGFTATSMDQIAGLAGVSKRTVYDHFGDKDGLFETAIDSMVASARRIISSFAAGFDRGEALEDLAVVYASSVLDERVVRLRRLMISEAERFPDLARRYFAQGPEAAIEALASGFDRLIDRGDLAADIDPIEAARAFAYLVLGPLIDQALFHPAQPPGSDEIEAHARAAAVTFSRAFGPGER